MHKNIFWVSFFHFLLFLHTTKYTYYHIIQDSAPSKKIKPSSKKSKNFRKKCNWGKNVCKYVVVNTLLYLPIYPSSVLPFSHNN